jgi:hypothetical protein
MPTVLALWIMSLAILLEIDGAEVRRAARELDNEERDAVFDRLLALPLSGYPQTKNLMYPAPDRLLYDALDASVKEQTRLVQKFLRRLVQRHGRPTGTVRSAVPTQVISATGVSSSPRS